VLGLYASSSADVGSVGVRAGHVDMSGFEDKIGMKTTLVASDPDKIAGHPYAPLSDDDRADMQAEIDDANQAFIAAIARGRGIKAAEVPDRTARARYSRPRGREMGAIDGVMTLRDVVAKYSSSRARLGLMRQQAALLGQLAEL
jgi:ClpP class serine protease